MYSIVWIPVLSLWLKLLRINRLVSRPSLYLSSDPIYCRISYSQMETTFVILWNGLYFIEDCHHSQCPLATTTITTTTTNTTISKSMLVYIFNWALGNKLQWNFNQNTNIIVNKNVFMLKHSNGKTIVCSNMTECNMAFAITIHLIPHLGRFRLFREPHCLHIQKPRRIEILSG